MGELQWSYFINSSKDNSAAYAAKFAWENRIPLLTRVLPKGEKQTNPLQPTAILNIPQQNLLLVTMRPVNGENAILMQMREIGGKKTSLNIESDILSIQSITVCDALGYPLSAGNETPEFNPLENKFIKVTWHPTPVPFETNE
jgi:hypothetical protein